MAVASRSLLPGFGLGLGYTILYLGLIVLIPLSALIIVSLGLTWDQWYALVSTPRVLASLKLSFGASAIAAVINVFAGLLVAWVLVRYHFPGKKIFDSLVDLPFALPTAVAGIALATIYGPNGWIGSWFSADGWIGQIIGPTRIAYTPMGIIIALTFIGLPFVVRTVQPILQELPKEMEEAAESMGASRWNIFWRIILPELYPALLTGFTLAFARAVGEYGSVVFIAGNIPGVTEITPLLIMTKLEQYDTQGASALALVMLSISFVLLLVVNILQRRLARR